MSLTTKLLNPIRQSLSRRHYHSPISQLVRYRFQPSQTWIDHLSPSIRHRFTKFLWRASHCARSNAYLAGSSLWCAGRIIGMGFSPLAVAFAMNGEDVLVVDDRDFSDTRMEVDWGGMWMVARKMWVPIVFFLTVFMNWYHPVMLLAKVSLLLLTTNPTPLSVYIFVDRLCQQSMRQQPYLYFIKILYAKKVEVQDYKLLCIATVEVRDQKFTLVGILGGWWAVPLSRETFSLFWAGLRCKFTPGVMA